jgi:hypothetical protein
MLKHWWAAWVQDWRSVPKSSWLPNLLLGAGWGLLGSMPITIISGLLANQDTRPFTFLSTLRSSLEISILLIPAMTFGNMYTFVQWWKSRDAYNILHCPIRTIQTGVFSGIPFVLVVGWLVPWPFGMALMNVPTDANPLLFEVAMMLIRSLIVLPLLITIGGFILSILTVFPVSLIFAPWQRRLWQHMAIQNPAKLIKPLQTS